MFRDLQCQKASISILLYRNVWEINSQNIHASCYRMKGSKSRLVVKRRNCSNLIIRLMTSGDLIQGLNKGKGGIRDTSLDKWEIEVVTQGWHGMFYASAMFSLIWCPISWGKLQWVSFPNDSIICLIYLQHLMSIWVMYKWF